MRALGEREEALLERGGVGNQRAQPDVRARELEAELLDLGFLGSDADAVRADDELADSREALADPGCPRIVGRAQGVGAGCGGAQLVETAFVDDAPRADDRDAVAQLLDLVHEVAREQHGDAAGGQRADQGAHVPHARRVEPGGGLVEQQQPRAADQRPGDAEALAHAVRVAADAILRPVGEVHGVEGLVDLRARVAAVERRDELEVLAAGEVGIEARRLDEPRHAIQCALAVDHRIPAEEPCAAPARTDQPEQDAQRCGLAGAVGAEVSVDVARLDGEVDVVDGGDGAVGLDESARLDDRGHASTARNAASAAFGGNEPTSV